MLLLGKDIKKKNNDLGGDAVSNNVVPHHEHFSDDDGFPMPGHRTDIIMATSGSSSSIPWDNISHSNPSRKDRPTPYHET